MKYITLLVITISIFGCNNSSDNRNVRFSLFETSKGIVYLLNLTSGETKIIYPNKSAPKLVLKNIYESEDGKRYQYQGDGKLKELTKEEEDDILIKKYLK
jgi:hypothetical protein